MECTGIGCHCVRCGHLERINTLNRENLELSTELAQLRKQLADLRGDAARYRTLRSTLQTDGSFDIGEAYLKLKVVGAYPEDSDWDATIDALAAQSAREKP